MLPDAGLQPAWSPEGTRDLGHDGQAADRIAHRVCNPLTDADKADGETGGDKEAKEATLRRDADDAWARLGKVGIAGNSQDEFSHCLRVCGALLRTLGS